MKSNWQWLPHISRWRFEQAFKLGSISDSDFPLWTKPNTRNTLTASGEVASASSRKLVTERGWDIMTPVTVWQGRVGKCECGKPTRERRESTFDDDSPQILRQLDFGELIVSSLLAVTRFVEQEENDRTSCERACHDYSPNTTIDKIWTRYVFDRRLRLVFMDALELLEVWNRKLGIMPMIPNRKNDSDWHQPIVVGNDRVFGVLTLLKYSLDRVAL